MFSAIPYVFETVYHFNLEQSNGIFASVCITGVLFTFVAVFQEKAASRMGKISAAPESSLYFACVESAFLPIGMFWFGWAASASVPWIVPTLGISAATIGIFSIYLATFK